MLAWPGMAAGGPRGWVQLESLALHTAFQALLVRQLCRQPASIFEVASAQLQSAMLPPLSHAAAHLCSAAPPSSSSCRKRQLNVQAGCQFCDSAFQAEVAR